MARTEPPPHEQARMMRLSNLIKLELNDKIWMILFESDDRKMSGILTSGNMTEDMLIRVLEETTRLLKEPHEPRTTIDT